MKKQQTTRNTIIDSALMQSVKVGLEGISLGGIASDVGMSKSGLFAHFKSKEALQLAVVEEAEERFYQSVVLPAEKKSPGLSRLKAYYVYYLDWIKGSRGLSACPFVTFVQEYDDRPGAIRDMLVKSQVKWRKTLAISVRDAIKNHEINDSANPEQISFELIGAALSFQIASQLLNSKKSRTLANIAFDHVIQHNG